MEFASVLAPTAALSQAPPLPFPKVSTTPPDASRQPPRHPRPRASFHLQAAPLARRVGLHRAGLAKFRSKARPRVNSSTIKRRTQRFLARALDSIAEHPLQDSQDTPRPVHGARKRSYAQAASGVETSTHRNRRRLTPTTTTSTPTSPATLTPVAPRCASMMGIQSFGGGSMVLALAPRYTSAGSPQAGPTQMQSPCVLFPAIMAGSPNFQSLDGMVLVIAQAASEERIQDQEEAEVEARLGLEDCVIYGEEDGLMKLRAQAQLHSFCR
ncbi:hypothetical protein B0H14DRAFT_352699 [Mycena olivaceomarginata]|nr:hypothetical protein B0H14DRAFT_352699 [Mycena olivaceomarginata]